MPSYRLDLGDLIDMEMMQFVSPYEINPIVIDDVIVASSEAPTVTQQVSPLQNSLALQKRDISQTALKMEEFGDLSALLLGPNVDLIDPSVDEFNTSVFDKNDEAFGSSPQVNENKPNLKVKVEYNTQYCTNNYTGLDLAPDNHHHHQVQIRGNYSIISTVDSEQNDGAYLYPPNVHSITLKEKTFDNNNLSNITNSTTSPQKDQYSNVSSPAEDQNMENYFPHYYDHLYDAKPRLRLITGQQQQQSLKLPLKEDPLGSLNTPDVIEDVVSMGNDFNILDLVNNEDITIINADEELFKSLTSPSVWSSEPSTPSTTVSKETATNKPRRRRKLSDDDEDEDYVPPTKKKKPSITTIHLPDIDVEHSENSSDDDSSEYQPKKSKPRGRPSKRTCSVSSDGDVSKYRELRDKNNEASRKSRLKRKLKEQEYEREADELHMKNVRLKAQVEELEKMVSTFRSNLFKILINK